VLQALSESLGRYRGIADVQETVNDVTTRGHTGTASARIR
jgi:hypothetical protein